ncbi:hypothetical protein MKZ38_005304 [Zalerion maritima]|uniref:Glutamate-1-semialdehyde 2,1-aminomutase n=1 Tax=Zalerion maritima TaxID=339359 RepID=A0AAD5WP17_9PEZI|nr:hypothetical protein MKZ38_005304 [Zalerion maritima]
MPSPHPAQEALDAARVRFSQRNARSQSLHQTALSSLPGGNTRSILHTSPFPISLRSGHAHTVTSEDGHTYVDLVAEMTAGLYGHSHPLLISTIKNTLDEVGLNLGGTIEQEAVLAKAICERFDLDTVRLANSGTEGNLHALGAARKFQEGRGKGRKVVVFEGGYHGGVLHFPAGKGQAENNVDRDDFIITPFNDISALEQVLEENGDDVAAVLMEPMLSAGGCIPGTRNFLRSVRRLTREKDILLILDEVVTSRLTPGGLGREHGLEPDLKTMGKWLGGGLAFGCFGGRSDIMSVYDPRTSGALSHSGTFNNNTLAMRAGHTGLTKVFTPEACVNLNNLGDSLRTNLTVATRSQESHGMCWTGHGSVLGLHFYKEQPYGKDGKGENGFEYRTEEDEVWKELFWLEMMEEGFWLARRGLVALVLDTPTEEVDRFVAAVKGFLRKYQDIR